MKINWTAGEAQEQCPVEAEEIMRRAQKSNSDLKPEDLTWELSWAAAYLDKAKSGVEALDEFFNQMEEVAKKGPKARTEKSFQQQLDEQLKPICAVTLKAKVGRRRWESVLPAGRIPQVIIDTLGQKIREDMREEARIEGLTPEARDRETAELLGELGMNPGFFAITLEPQKKARKPKR